MLWFKHIAITLALAFVSLPAVASAGAHQPPERKKVGIVLSGGGAKGVAHISVLRALEQAGIPIDYIAGTSMGAIIGGLYSIGYTTQMLDSLVRVQNWDMLIYDRIPRSDLSFGAKERDEKFLLTIDISSDRKVKLPSGLIGGHNIYNFIYELTYGYHDSIAFNTLPIPFACVGYDLVSGQVVTLDRGSLPTCMRASMSIPGAFHPVQLDSLVLVDGGVGNNFPADVVKKMGADIVIGVDVTSPLRTQYQLDSFTDIFEQLTGLSAAAVHKENMQMTDLYIHPDITGYTASSFSTDAVDSLLMRGSRAAAEHWGEIIALRNRIGIPDDFTPAVPECQPSDIPIRIGTIEFAGVKHENEKTLIRITGLRENSVVTRDDLRRAVNKLMGTNSLSEVRYTLRGDSVHTVVFDVRESLRSTISAGLRFDTEEMAAILLAVRYMNNRVPNWHMDLTGKLGTNPYGKLSLVYGNETRRRSTLSYTFRSNELSLYERGEKISNSDFFQHSIDLNHSNIQIHNFRLTLGIRYDYYNFQSFIANIDSFDKLSSMGLANYYGLMQWESLDSRYYPRRGISALVSYTLTTTNFVSYNDATPFSAIAADYTAVVSLNKRLTLIPGFFGRVLIGRTVAYPAENFMGGAVNGRYVPHQIAFVGIQNFERFERSVVGVRFDARMRMFLRNYISLKMNYAKQADNFFDILNGKGILGVGINYSYNSFIGPIDVLLDYSNYNKKVGIYFNLGYYF